MSEFSGKLPELGNTLLLFLRLDGMVVVVVFVNEVQKVSWGTGGKRGGERDTKTRDFSRGSGAFCQIAMYRFFRVSVGCNWA